VLNPQRLAEFVDKQIQSIGTSACPPYHLAIVIGGMPKQLVLFCDCDCACSVLFIVLRVLMISFVFYEQSTSLMARAFGRAVFEDSEAREHEILRHTSDYWGHEWKGLPYAG
jgi:hypothetical protein